VLKSTRTYNGLGQRTLKDSTPHDNRVIRAVYDEAGHVLSEAVLQGGTLLHYREYVRLEDPPLAQMTNVKAGSTWTSSIIDYLHTNQLERPLFMTDASGTEVYRWQPTDAFAEIGGQFTYIGISTAPLNRYMQSVARPSKTWNA